MTAVPEPTATTKPLLNTVQIELFELAQFTFLSLALSGIIVAVSCIVLPRLVKTIADSLRVTPVTGCITVTAQLSFISELLAEVTVTTAFPALCAVTMPSSLTDTTLLSEDDHFTLAAE